MALSNYEITKRRVQAEFASHDLAPALEKFSLTADERYLYLRFVSTPCRIERDSGRIFCSDDGFAYCKEAGFELTLSVFDLLFDSRPDCRPAGVYCRINSLPGLVKTASAPAEDAVVPSQAHRVQSDPEAFCRACERLGGSPFGIGDLSYRLPIFEALCAVVQFWFSDADFPPQLQILWDRNILQYVRYETVWYIRGYLMERLFRMQE